MKKISILAMAALFLAACNTTDEQSLVEEQSSSPLLFDATTNVPTTRAFSTFGSINTNALMASGDGFGVFAFHKRDEGSVSAPVPGNAANFMFNQQVHYTGSWIYSPLKYWPNETGNKAESEDEESLSFLAYAPYISAGEAESNENGNKGGIVGISENTKAFDEIAIDYQVAQDPKQQVDLLWGVSDGKEETSYVDVEGHTVSPEGGMPLYDLTKPQVSYKVPFLFKHALSKLNLTIDAIVDAVDGNTNPVANGTKIFVRQVTFDGNLATEGTLLLKNTEANKPLWKAIGGTDALAAAKLVLNDGRKKDNEADTENGADPDEKFACLNPMIIQKGKAFGTDATEVGVTNATVSLLKPAADDGTASLMVIPVPVENPDESTMKVTIVYDVLTFDENLGVNLQDGSEQKGSTVTNVITKTIEKFVFEAGKEYTINMHLGMNSVKFNATVSDWVDNGAKPVDLPTNDVASSSGDDDDTDFDLATTKMTVVTDASSYEAAWNKGYSEYYRWLDAAYPHGDTAAGYGTDYNDKTTEWDDSNSRHHSWNSYLNMFGENPSYVPTRIVLDLNMTPAFVGTVKLTYDGHNLYEGANYGTECSDANSTVSRDVPASQTDATVKGAFIVVDLREFIGGATASVADFDISKVKATCHRTN